MLASFPGNQPAPSQTSVGLHTGTLEFYVSSTVFHSWPVAEAVNLGFLPPASSSSLDAHQSQPEGSFLQRSSLMYPKTSCTPAHCKIWNTLLVVLYIWNFTTNSAKCEQNHVAKIKSFSHRSLRFCDSFICLKFLGSDFFTGLKKKMEVKEEGKYESCSLLTDKTTVRHCCTGPDCVGTYIFLLLWWRAKVVEDGTATSWQSSGRASASGLRSPTTGVACLRALATCCSLACLMELISIMTQSMDKFYPVWTLNERS